MPTVAAPPGWTWTTAADGTEVIVPTGFPSIQARAEAGLRTDPPPNPTTGAWVLVYRPEGGLLGYALASADPDAIATATDVPDGGEAVLTGHVKIAVTVQVGKGGQILWERQMAAVVKMAPGQSLLLTNRLSEFGKTFSAAGFGVLQVNDVSGWVAYRPLNRGEETVADESDLFGKGVADSLRSQLQHGADLVGEWRIDKTNPLRWVTAWPGIKAPLSPAQVLPDFGLPSWAFWVIVGGLALGGLAVVAYVMKPSAAEAIAAAPAPQTTVVVAEAGATVDVSTPPPEPAPTLTERAVDAAQAVVEGADRVADEVAAHDAEVTQQARADAKLKKRLPKGGGS